MAPGVGGPNKSARNAPSSCAGSPVLFGSGWFCSAGAVTNGTVFCLPGTCWGRPVCHPASVSSGWG